jgi:hypothetical protein
MDARFDAVDAQFVLSIADTNELETDWAFGGRLDLCLFARASQKSVDDLPTNAELTTALGTGSWATSLAQASVWTSTRGTYLDICYDASSQLLGVGSDVGDEIRSFLGLVGADLDTQLADLPTNTELATAITTALTTALTEGYRGTGATGSVRDLLYEILQFLTEFANSGTTRTVKKLDGSTTAKTYTYDDAGDPTSLTETT